MRLVMLTLLFFLAQSALAHKASDSYVVLAASGKQVSGYWDIALRDLDLAVGLDASQDGQLTWGEVRGQHAAILAYALPRLQLRTRGNACTLQAGVPEVARHVDGHYSRIPLQAQCLHTVDDLELQYDLLFDRDSLHRGLASITLAGHTQSLIFSPEHAVQRMAGQAGSSSALPFLYQGVVHIWTGYDHLLFLMSLLLPAVLVWNGRGWDATGSLRESSRDV